MNSEHSRIEWKPLLGFGALTLGTGGLAAFLTRTGTKEYAQLSQPSFAPPDWVFPVVWSILYAVMAVSAYRVTRTGRHRGAMALFGIQLAVNFFWPLIFFNLKAFWAAFYWLLLLIALIAAMIAAFAQIDRPAALLQIPYVLWCGFAAVLCRAVALLNP